MNIILKQDDIEVALKQFIHNKGFSLRGKDVAFVFTSGRKDTGVSVELAISDKPQTAGDAEGCFGDFLETIGAVLGGCVMVHVGAPAQAETEEVKPEAVEPAEAPVAEVAAETEVPAAEPVADVAEAPAKAPVASLFGG